MAIGRKLYFLTDNCVPDSIGNYLRRRGHSVYRVREKMAHDSPDQIVATAALKADRILISVDKDFNAQRFCQERFALLSRVGLSGDGLTLTPALKEHIDVIEFQFCRAIDTHMPRMIAFVRAGQVRFKH